MLCDSEVLLTVGVVSPPFAVCYYSVFIYYSTNLSAVVFVADSVGYEAPVLSCRGQGDGDITLRVSVCRSAAESGLLHDGQI